MGNKLQKMWKKEIIASVEATSTCITIAGICTSGTCKEKNGTFDITFQRERERMIWSSNIAYFQPIYNNVYYNLKEEIELKYSSIKLNMCHWIYFIDQRKIKIVVLVVWPTSNVLFFIPHLDAVVHIFSDWFI